MRPNRDHPTAPEQPMTPRVTLPTPRPDHRRVVIVGAGFGGLAAAKALKGADLDVVLIDRTNHHLFQPLLYQVATAALSAPDIAVAIRTLLRRQTNATMLMAEVTGVDHQARRVLLGDGATIGYDWLILATGAAYSFFGHPEWSQEALVLKSLDDASAIRRRLLCAFETAERTPSGRPPTFVVVGGGPTGVETAGTIAELARQTLKGEFRNIDPTQARVILYEAGPRVLSAFPVELSDYAARALGELGVEVRTGAPVEEIDAGRVRAAGETIDAAAVLWCAGVKARPAADWLEAEAGGGGAVLVDRDCSVPDRPGVYAIGDVSRYVAPDGPLPALAPVAKQQGRWVGRRIAAEAAGQAPPPPFRYQDWGSMAVIGRSRAIAVLGGRNLKGVTAWLAWSLVHLMLLIDFRSRLTVYVNWTWAWFTRGRGARLITGAWRNGG